MRQGVRIGVDVGKARIGIARTDFHAMLATPVETVARGDGDLERVLAICREVDAIEVVVGLPLSLSGANTPSTDDAIDFARLLAASAALPVRLVDERLTTVSAQAALHASGRNSRNSRAVIDQVAATILIQHAVDAERSSGNPPGTLVDPQERR